MHPRSRRLLLPLLGLFALAGAGLRLAPQPAVAADPVVVTKGPLQVAAPIAYSTPPAARNGAAYMTLHNRGTEADRLVGGSSPAAGRIEIHTTVRDGDVMRMRPVPAIELPPGGTVALQRGGLHVMLIDLRTPLQAGATFPLTLIFEKAGAVEVTVRIESVRGGAMPHRHH